MLEYILNYIGKEVSSHNLNPSYYYEPNVQVCANCLILVFSSSQELFHNLQ